MSETKRCSACGADDQHTTLVRGPSVNLCSTCLLWCLHHVISSGIDKRQEISDAGTTETFSSCSSCGRTSTETPLIVHYGENIVACRECLVICVNVLLDDIGGNEEKNIRVDVPVRKSN